jgi:hypothetical protein
VKVERTAASPLFALLRDIALIVFVIVYCIHTL